MERADRVKRNKKIVQYAIDNPTLSNKTVGEKFGLGIMATGNILRKSERYAEIIEVRDYARGRW